MQSIVLQSIVSIASPSQSFPPQDGGGLSQLLVLFWTPPSHSSEQFPTVQFDQPPSTVHYIKILLIQLCIIMYIYTYIPGQQ